MSGQAESWSRRRFLASLAALGAANLAAPVRGHNLTAPKKLKLGFDNFSIRTFNWKAPRLIEYAASLKVDTLLLSDLNVYESLDEDYLKKIRIQAERAGIELHAGTSSICPTSKSYNEKKWGKYSPCRLAARCPPARPARSPLAGNLLRGSRKHRDRTKGEYQLSVTPRTESVAAPSSRRPESRSCRIPT